MRAARIAAAARASETAAEKEAAAPPRQLASRDAGMTASATGIGGQRA